MFSPKSLLSSFFVPNKTKEESMLRSVVSTSTCTRRILRSARQGLSFSSVLVCFVTYDHGSQLQRTLFRLTRILRQNKFKAGNAQRSKGFMNLLAAIWAATHLSELWRMAKGLKRQSWGPCLDLIRRQCCGRLSASFSRLSITLSGQAYLKETRVKLGN